MAVNLKVSLKDTTKLQIICETCVVMLNSHRIIFSCYYKTCQMVFRIISLYQDAVTLLYQNERVFPSIETSVPPKVPRTILIQ